MKDDHRHHDTVIKGQNRKVFLHLHQFVGILAKCKWFVHIAESAHNCVTLDCICSRQSCACRQQCAFRQQCVRWQIVCMQAILFYAHISVCVLSTVCISHNRVLAGNCVHAVNIVHVACVTRMCAMALQSCRSIHYSGNCVECS
jgi:hypothetical protein